MEGNGAYNKAAVCQGNLVDIMSDLLNQAMARFAKNVKPKTSYCIADLGASQGRNSLSLIQHILRHLQANFPEDAAAPEYMILHEDQPSNDYTTLLDTIASPASYVHSFPNVFNGVISKSFYERLVPAASVDIFVSYISLQWMSHVPTPLPGPIILFDDPECARSLSSVNTAKWRQAGHNDLINFLRLRATELVDNGSLCLAYPSNDGNQDMFDYFRLTRDGLRDTVAMGGLSSTTLDRIAVASILRTTDDFLAAAAQVPELQVHDYQHVRMDVRFNHASELVNFFTSTCLPTIEAAMTDDERNSSRFRQVYNTCMAKSLSRVIGGRTRPFYEHFRVSYFFCHLTRRERAVP
ncbi:unnamed protein product [Aphanomyces euteiches]|uniref:SAM dependent carboxyl methyltransferase n=1 Tax=Aphanomyces euteiches TaxID=100861 RepID=A0A6G0XTT8_9STRA|nr:hypothetical protein Ae201684_001598 [Aphanomyces euteiches]KAH9075192.1 hypothetical protein Ae201684P_003876 [Aphanomyces euteiches]KAH9143730.1 hypothetical protein AeRB84_012296 [Aphanomyces euteiches]